VALDRHKEIRVAGKFYTVDLHKFQLGETRQKWIQGFPQTTVEHPIWGTLEFNEKFFQEIEENFRNDVRGIVPDIDYNHKSHDAKAAGWVRDVENRGPDGLWLLVEWTDPAYDAILNDEYRYFSPEFGPYKDEKTGREYTNVLLGGGITNRPFLKELQPINLSEIMSSAEPQTNQGEGMKELLAKLSAALGVELSEDDATNETAVMAKLTEILAKSEQTEVELSELKANAPKDEDAELKELSEKSPAIAKMLAERESDRKRLADLENLARTERTARQLSEVKVEGKVLPPAFIAQVTPLLAAMPKTLSEGVFQAITNLVKTGPVQLGETGSTGPTGRQERTMTDSAYKQFNEAVAAVQARKADMSYADAARIVAFENGDLWAAYNDSLMEG
jgi:Mu-like prophage I protein